MEYLIPIWWHSVSKIVQKHSWEGFHTAAVIVRKWATPFVCLSEGATVTKGGGAYRLHHRTKLEAKQYGKPF